MLTLHFRGFYFHLRLSRCFLKQTGGSLHREQQAAQVWSETAASESADLTMQLWLENSRTLTRLPRRPTLRPSGYESPQF